MGFKLIATSIIPTAQLIYGSEDAGKLVFKEIEEFNVQMEKIGDLLGLRKHIVGTTQHSLKELACVGDLEGHLGRDERYYLLVWWFLFRADQLNPRFPHFQKQDFGRLFPPQQPQLNLKTCTHLYHLFRPGKTSISQSLELNL